ncbi:MAG TPA: hydrogenase maturation nickel metallochaperone HypA [Acetobacteraceae bacterium]|jgi:hydrogenase nickel incorporation protein HypA/HybF|nr:hydrogenase maturation nickel metallochaperone HypA [Acetobacteraceae bacterium]
MHELALSQSVVDLVAEHAAREGLRKVTRVILEIGTAAAVEPQALCFCFDLVAADTVVHGAELAIETVALRARCQRCLCEFSPAALYECCPECGGFDRIWLAGREMRVKSFAGE